MKEEATGEETLRCWDKFLLFLKAISLGKFNHGLYHNERLSYASILGGVMSLIIVAVIIGYSIILIIPIQRGSEYLTATEIRDLVRSPYFDAINF